MSTIPPWLLGRHVTAATLQLQAPDATGTFVPGTSYTLTGLIDAIDYQGRQQAESIAALTSTRENRVPIQNDDGYVLTEILQSSGSGTFNLLATAFHSGTDYALIAFTRGGNSWAGYFLMESYTESLARGKTVGRLTLKQCDLGNANANPAYSSP